MSLRKLMGSNRPHALAIRLLFPLLAISLGGCATMVEPGSASEGASLLDIAPAEINSPNATTLYAVSRLLSVKDRADQGERILLNIIERYPKFVPAYNDLAEIRMLDGRLEDARLALGAGLAQVPNDPVLLNNVGICSLFEGDYQAALDSFRTAASVMPQERRYRANTALALGLLGESEEAFELYDQMLPLGDALNNIEVISRLKAGSQRSSPPVNAEPIEPEVSEAEDLSAE